MRQGNPKPSSALEVLNLLMPMLKDASNQAEILDAKLDGYQASAMKATNGLVERVTKVEESIKGCREAHTERFNTVGARLDGIEKKMPNGGLKKWLTIGALGFAVTVGGVVFATGQHEAKQDSVLAANRQKHVEATEDREEFGQALAAQGKTLDRVALLMELLLEDRGVEIPDRTGGAKPPIGIKPDTARRPISGGG